MAKRLERVDHMMTNSLPEIEPILKGTEISGVENIHQSPRMSRRRKPHKSRGSPNNRSKSREAHVRFSDESERAAINSSDSYSPDRRDLSRSPTSHYRSDQVGNNNFLRGNYGQSQNKRYNSGNRGFGSNSRGNRGTGRNNRGRCFTCNQFGHYSRFCWRNANG